MTIIQSRKVLLAALLLLLGPPSTLGIRGKQRTNPGGLRRRILKSGGGMGGGGMNGGKHNNHEVDSADMGMMADQSEDQQDNDTVGPLKDLHAAAVLQEISNDVPVMKLTKKAKKKKARDDDSKKKNKLAKAKKAKSSDKVSTKLAEGSEDFLFQDALIMHAPDESIEDEFIGKESSDEESVVEAMPAEDSPSKDETDTPIEIPVDPTELPNEEVTASPEITDAPIEVTEPPVTEPPVEVTDPPAEVTDSPTAPPTDSPTVPPTTSPTMAPTEGTAAPTGSPTPAPTDLPVTEPPETEPPETDSPETDLPLVTFPPTTSDVGDSSGTQPETSAPTGAAVQDPTDPPTTSPTPGATTLAPAGDTCPTAIQITGTLEYNFVFADREPTEAEIESVVDATLEFFVDLLREEYGDSVVEISGNLVSSEFDFGPPPIYTMTFEAIVPFSGCAPPLEEVNDVLDLSDAQYEEYLTEYVFPIEPAGQHIFVLAARVEFEGSVSYVEV